MHHGLYGAYRRSGARSLVKTGSRRKISCFSSGGVRRRIQLRWLAIRIVSNPEVIAHGYFGAVDCDSEDWILRPASVYCPKKRTVAIESKVTGTHIPPSCANCRVI
ncbi:MAG: hypothetical protein QOH35_2832 [Acidobacteriaceae bacterium]|jgi:hypothetical protein|nr:hypothetical protein [Acidobacteriaceae bacterium]MDX6463171.1 hypothetical protein [Acidobacteriaceae bacterium]MEA2541466.1 hypothetical protein [Acidobacteriaceae bacterium]MEA3005412.1 hypothetical protein [Acidobacteriaceae bacterium]